MSCEDSKSCRARLSPFRIQCTGDADMNNEPILIIAVDSISISSNDWRNWRNWRKSQVPTSWKQGAGRDPFQCQLERYGCVGIDVEPGNSERARKEKEWRGAGGRLEVDVLEETVVTGEWHVWPSSISFSLTHPFVKLQTLAQSNPACPLQRCLIQLQGFGRVASKKGGRSPPVLVMPMPVKLWLPRFLTPRRVDDLLRSGFSFDNGPETRMLLSRRHGNLTGGVKPLLRSTQDLRSAT